MLAKIERPVYHAACKYEQSTLIIFVELSAHAFRIFCIEYGLYKSFIKRTLRGYASFSFYPSPYGFFICFAHLYFRASGQSVVTGVVTSSPRFLPSIFIAHRVQHSHCSSIFHRVFLTHALALSATGYIQCQCAE